MKGFVLYVSFDNEKIGVRYNGHALPKGSTPIEIYDARSEQRIIWHEYGDLPFEGEDGSTTTINAYFEKEKKVFMQWYTFENK